MPDFSIQSNVPLRDKNWFQTGGPARFFAEPENPQDFQQTLAFAREQNLPIFVLGQGANILISDEGFDGLVIRPQLKKIIAHDVDREYVLVSADSGVIMSDLIEWCLARNIAGLEEFSGIPGTVGGSVYINLHYFQFLLSHFLMQAQVIDRATGQLCDVDATWFKFGYNQSKLLDEQHYLISATFKLKKISDLEVAFARGRRTEIIRHRTARYPSAYTCGSFFRNFHDHEVTIESNGKKMIYIAYYLDKIGVKGQLAVGNAIVSYQHANMLINRGNATSSDIVNLAREMQRLVAQNFGIMPQPECRLIGFKEYPLLQRLDGVVDRLIGSELQK